MTEQRNPEVQLTKEDCTTQEGVERTYSQRVYRPQVDIIDGPERILLRVNMPGVDEEHVDVTLEKNVLTIHGNVAPPQYDGYQLVYSEYGVGDYERSFKLSNEIDRDKIAATVSRGVLTLELPKVKTAVQTKIPVSAG